MAPAPNTKPQPLTAAERKRRSRANKKSSDPNYQTNENRRIEELRKRKVESMNTQQLKAYRMAANQRKKKSRSMLKEQAMQRDLELSSICETTSEIDNKAYKKPQSLGKAIRKSMRSLPSSPRKQLAVVTGIAKRVGFSLDYKKKSHNDNRTVSTETKELVEQFYFRSDIVYTEPSMKGVVTVWKNGKKETLRRHYLTMYLKEAFALFKISHPDTVIGLSTFCTLRPPNVLLMKDTPSDQCLCMIHENFFLKLKALQIFYYREWWGTVLCSDKDLTSSCWMGSCLECQNGKKLAIEMDPATAIYWYEWVKEKTSPEGEIEKKHIQKILKDGCASELLELLLQSLPVVQEHTRVKRIQAEEFQSDQTDPSKRLLQIDFSMSYSCEYQNEVQSALWSRQSVTLFTAALLQGKSCSTYLICSDSNKKDKDTVATFLNILYEMILDKNAHCTNSTLATDIIWSDGPSSEFKNQFMVKLLQQLSHKFKRPFQWKYFATSHGKGIVDGVGGNAKSLVRAEVMSKKTRGTIVQSSLEFANVVSTLMPKTKVIHVSQAEIKSRITEMNPWMNSLAVPGIRKMHFIMCDCKGNIQLFNTSKDVTSFGNAGPSGSSTYGLDSDNEDDQVPESLQTNEPEEYCSPKQGSFILVDYSTKKSKKIFLGQLVQSDSQRLEHEVSFLRAVDDKKTAFRFPENEDVAWISDEQIVRENCPKLIDFARELYIFESKVNVFE